MSQKFLREITPLVESDCFMLFARKKSKFDFPLHYHEEFELNFIRNAKGAQRVVGDHIEEIENLELALVGPNLQHGWFTHNCRSREIEEITIQFHKDFLDATFLSRNQLSFVKKMFEESARGILFSQQTTMQLSDRIVGLNQKQGFDSVLEFMSILHDLSISRNMTTLSDAPSGNKGENLFYSNKLVQRVLQYIHDNFNRQITIEEAAELTGMPAAPFGRFFKKQTGNTFKDVVNEARLGNAARMLIDTAQSVNEIAYRCGFNNLSYFNRLFKEKKHCTPKEFREKFSGTRIFI